MNVPTELREALLEFTISYLLERPADVLDYAVEFFTKMRDNRDNFPYYFKEKASPDESVASNAEEFALRFNNRRKSVFAEAYNPEEDDDDDIPKQIFPKSDKQRQRLADSVKNILLFRSLDHEQINEVLDAMFEKNVHQDESIIKQGDDGDYFYVIQSGVYEAFIFDGKEEKKIHTYDNVGSFGELALLYNMPRAATITAVTDGSLWAMDRQTFRRIVLKSTFKKRQMYEHLIECVPMLKTLQPYERMNLADALIPRIYPDKSRIIKQGDAADGMFFVEDGLIRITVLGEGGAEVEVKRVEKGDYFGELALVTHKRRAASAYALGTVKVAFLDVEAFERLLGPCMEVMKRNIDDYESQLVKIFGSKYNISDVR
ncbi:hypothetical protein AAG570_008245 [Ranatra chinensis]|uniref:cAMP-dependent protein kinase type II regulatory subunit n=1 Tax=Ranatra chinensis TaxID=642074 RepID=A0ABD0XSP7_9HEMI